MIDSYFPHLGNIYGPDLKDIIGKENELIDFVVEKNLKSFSLDLFKQEYDFYGRDLLDEMENEFRDYLYIFFQDEGMPWLAVSLREGSKFTSAFNIVDDIKIGFKRPLFEKLVANSFTYSSPYFPLYELVKKVNGSTPVTLSIRDWAKAEVKEKFVDFMNSNYANEDVISIMKAIQTHIA